MSNSIYNGKIYDDGYRVVERVGFPTAGGAYAKYVIFEKDFYDTIDDNTTIFEVIESVQFQNDTIPNVGVVGATNEALLAMVQDRLTCFQASEFACDENQRALDAVTEALNALEERTRERQSRGVEGTHEV